MSALLSPAARAERDQRIAAFARDGYTTPEIAAMERTTTRTVQRARVRTGVAVPSTCNAITAAELRRAADMLDDGASYREVGRTLGRSPDAIRFRLPGRSQWPPSSGVEYRKFREALDRIPTPCAWRSKVGAA